MTFARVNTNISDQTVQNATIPLGIAAMAGITQRGAVGKAQLIRSGSEFREVYGEVLNPTISTFSILALRALNNGAQLYISRVEHLTDINDATTTTSTAAAGNNGGVFAFSQRVFSVNVGVDTLVYAGNLLYAIAPAQIHTILYQGGGSGNLTVLSVTYASGYTTVVYTTTVVSVTVGDNGTWSKTLLNTFALIASSVGSWGNQVSFEIKASNANIANTVDIHAYYSGQSDLNEVFPSFPITPTTNDITRFNAAMKLVQYVSHTAPIIQCPIVPLTLGTDTYGSITEIDYEGSGVGETGLHAFDPIEGFVKCLVPEIATNTMDNTVLNYVLSRGSDSLAILRCPEGLDALFAMDYRQCTGIYTGGTKIDNWRAAMLFGGIKIISPYDNETKITIPWVGDFIGLSATKDNTQKAWFSISGVNSIPLGGVIDIVYNINTTARLSEADSLTNNGLIPIIKKRVNGGDRILAWGDRSLQIADSRLQYLNVAELLIYIANGIKPFSEGALFQPNDPISWKTVYRKVDSFMAQVQAGRGVSSYQYEGDQNAENASQAIINTPTTIAQGRYIFNLYLDPINTINSVTQNIIVARLVATANGITLIDAGV